MRRFLVRVLMVVVGSLLVRVASAQSSSIEGNTVSRTVHGKVVPSERDEQESLFNYYFQDQKLKYETQFEKLKTSASVPKWRIPYSADIHPQVAGGLSGTTGRRGYASYSPLSTYDRAFNSGRESASSYETQRVMGTQRTLFPGMRLRRNNEGWEGYCSGFTASTIRHPEPIRAVDAGTVGGTPGVIFQPSDIKALLSSIYNRTTDDSYLYLAPPSASDGGPNMGTFHLALANYIGAAGHPIGFDRTKGRAPWNNPIYAYEVNSIRDAGSSNHLHYKTVDLTLTYSFYGSDQGQQTDTQTGEIRGNQKQQMALRYNVGWTTVDGSSAARR